MSLHRRQAGIWRLSLEQIEATVADHLGPGRLPGNQSGPCFSRQVSMYLAKHVGGWSTTRIGWFYNGRHHTTVLHAIAKVEELRATDESVDALIEVITSALSPRMEDHSLTLFRKKKSGFARPRAIELVEHRRNDLPSSHFHESP